MLLEKPLAMFFPIGVVRISEDGAIDPILDPDCCLCAMKCYSADGWAGFVRKMKGILKPAPESFRLSIRSYGLPGAELAAAWCDKSGEIFCENKYKFV